MSLNCIEEDSVSVREWFNERAFMSLFQQWKSCLFNRTTSKC